MSEKIPNDILLAARRVYDALGRGSISDSERIALAILDERKRGLKIAIDMSDRSIASTIRGTE